MENLHDYSNYISAAYMVAALAMSALMLIVVVKYFMTKSKSQNEKSA